MANVLLQYEVQHYEQAGSDMTTAFSAYYAAEQVGISEETVAGVAAETLTPEQAKFAELRGEAMAMSDWLVDQYHVDRDASYGIAGNWVLFSNPGVGALDVVDAALAGHSLIFGGVRGISRISVPQKLLVTEGVVDLSAFDFSNPKRGMPGDGKGYNSYVNSKTGWFIQKDVGDYHGGSAYKLFDAQGNRRATLDQYGKILRP